jgi:CP family cyanate transporter-like MFS transporter
MDGWRGVFVVLSLVAVPGIFFWWVVARKDSRRPGRPGTGDPERPDQQEAHPDHSFFCQSSKPVVICGLLLSLLNLTFYCTMGWLPTYLSEQGWKSTGAAAATSLITYAELPAVFLIPVISDRVGKRKFIIILCFLLIAICSTVISLRPSLTWWITPFLGIAVGGIFALILALPVELVERQAIGRAAGAIISIGYVGALIGPPLAGYLRDLTGQFSAGFLIMAFAGIVATGLTFLLPEARTPIN